MGKLNTDFKDDILSEKMNGKKRVKLIPQEDDTYILEDVTEYTQVGSSYGQKEINLLNSTVNGKLDSEKVIDDLGTALAVTEEGVPVGCKAISALNSNLADSLGGITFGVDADGNYGYKKAGADTVTPFRHGAMLIGTFSGGYPSAAATTSKYTNLTTSSNSIITVDDVLPSMEADDYIAVVTTYYADHYSNWAGSTSNGTGATLKIEITDNKTIIVKNTGVCTINYADDTQYRYHTRVRVEGKVYYIGK